MVLPRRICPSNLARSIDLFDEVEVKQTGQDS